VNSFEFQGVEFTPASCELVRVVVHLKGDPCLKVVIFKYLFIFNPKIGEDETILTSIFLRWVGSTTNQLSHSWI